MTFLFSHTKADLIPSLTLLQRGSWQQLVDNMAPWGAHSIMDTFRPPLPSLGPSSATQGPSSQSNHTAQHSAEEPVCSPFPSFLPPLLFLSNFHLLLSRKWNMFTAKKFGDWRRRRWRWQKPSTNIPSITGSGVIVHIWLCMYLYTYMNDGLYTHTHTHKYYMRKYLSWYLQQDLSPTRVCLSLFVRIFWRVPMWGKDRKVAPAKLLYRRQLGAWCWLLGWGVAQWRKRARPWREGIGNVTRSTPQWRGRRVASEKQLSVIFMSFAVWHEVWPF